MVISYTCWHYLLLSFNCKFKVFLLQFNLHSHCMLIHSDKLIHTIIFTYTFRTYQYLRFQPLKHISISQVFKAQHLQYILLHSVSLISFPFIYIQISPLYRVEPVSIQCLHIPFIYLYRVNLIHTQLRLTQFIRLHFATLTYTRFYTFSIYTLVQCKSLIQGYTPLLGPKL